MIQTNDFPYAHRQLSPNQLIEIALERGEGTLCANQALVAVTGKRTGRSPKDRFIVKDFSTEHEVDWGNVNQPIDSEKFEALWERAYDYLKNKEVFISNLQVGADPQYGLPVTAITELAWHQLFVTQLFIRELSVETTESQTWTILNAANFKTDPVRDGVNSDGAVIICFSKRRILLCGIHYAGEMKKGMFSVLNFLLPAREVLPMHCSANVGKKGDVALFFGLSGTGKTTLSADPERCLIGDDEHGWSADRVFNFEGGCYAKCINLSQEREPMIWNAIQYGAIMENVVLDPKTRQPQYDDATLTENTRAAYPLEHIPMRVPENYAGHPKVILFLTCDLYGVLPPVAQLTLEQAAYYFLSGYTALVGSTEVGSGTGIKPTFSTCFGAPFFPRPPTIYAELLMKRIMEAKARVYLINTGWTGGSYGDGGERFSIPVTRSIVSAVLNGDIHTVPTEILPGFNFIIPTQMPGVDSRLLNPQKNWRGTRSYAEQSAMLVTQFIENFRRFKVTEEILAAAPQVILEN